MSASRLLRPVVLVAIIASGSTQADPPSRNGNVWDGVAHQPARSDVQEREKAAGFAASQEGKREDEEVARLARKLLKRH